LKSIEVGIGGKDLKGKIYVYHITLTNDELLKNMRIKGGSLEFIFSGVGKNFISVEDSDGKTIVLNKYNIVKAELVNVEK